MDSTTPSSIREKNLAPFKRQTSSSDSDDESLEHTVEILCTCQTIGEGVDTFHANMCVFIDPKTSPVQIIQNIGRIVRKPIGVEIPPSTVLLCCHVDKNKYEECERDPVRVDAVIRQDMSQTGNFHSIITVLAALNQEDPGLYEMCLAQSDRESEGEREKKTLKRYDRCNFFSSFVRSKIINNNVFNCFFFL
jgi:superfamily II DNA or RNA helicase